VLDFLVGCDVIFVQPPYLFSPSPPPILIERERVKEELKRVNILSSIRGLGRRESIGAGEFWWGKQ
jgi:hypothetical protein